jgi:capping protein alpha
VVASSEGGSSSSESRYIDPKTNKAWLFDHLRLSASEPRDILIDEECEAIRKELEKAAEAYGKEHFSEGVSKVFTTEQKRLKPLPKSAKTTSVAPVQTVDGSVTEVEEAAVDNVANPVLEDTPAKVDSENDASMTDAGVNDATSGDPAVEIGDEEVDAPKAAGTSETTDSEMTSAATPAPEVAEDSTMETNDEITSAPAPIEEAGSVQVQELAQPEKPEDSGGSAHPAEAAEIEEEEAPVEPLAKKFSLYFVGNKYNPANYW